MTRPAWDMFDYTATPSRETSAREVPLGTVEIEVFLSGQGELWNGRVWLPVSAGAVLAWYPGDQVAARTGPRDPYRCLVYMLYETPAAWPRLPEAGRWRTAGEAEAFAREMFARYHEGGGRASIGGSAWRRDAIYGRFLLEAERAATERAAWPTSLQRAVDLVAARSTEPTLDLAAMARAAGVSQATLHRLFREHLETSPGAYVIERRLARARRLLTTTDQQVQEVAASCGFGDAVHFTRLFRERVGATPSAYRDTHRTPSAWDR